MSAAIITQIYQTINDKMIISSDIIYKHDNSTRIDKYKIEMCGDVDYE